MINKCAKFHKDSPSDQKVKFNLLSAIKLSETAFCVQLCIETLCKRAISVAHLTKFSFGFFMKVSQKIPLYFFYTICMVQKVKNDQKLKWRGSCLNFFQHDWTHLVVARSSTRRLRAFKKRELVACRWWRPLQGRLHYSVVSSKRQHRPDRTDFRWIELRQLTIIKYCPRHCWEKQCKPRQVNCKQLDQSRLSIVINLIKADQDLRQPIRTSVSAVNW